AGARDETSGLHAGANTEQVRRNMERIARRRLRRDRERGDVRWTDAATLQQPPGHAEIDRDYPRDSHGLKPGRHASITERHDQGDRGHDGEDSKEQRDDRHSNDWSRTAPPL